MDPEDSHSQEGPTLSPVGEGQTILSGDLAPGFNMPVQPPEERKWTEGKKTHQRSSTAVRILDLRTPEEILGPNSNLAGDLAGDSGPEVTPSHVASRNTLGAAPETLVGLGTKIQPSHLSPSATTLPMAQIAALESESGYSNKHTFGDNQIPNAKLLDEKKGWIAKRHSLARPPALEFLDPDSPEITAESIRDSMRDGSSCQSSLSSLNTFSSFQGTLSTDSSNYRGGSSPENNGHETEWVESPENSPRNNRSFRPHDRFSRQRRSYGTPEMPRGNTRLPHISPSALTPRLATPAQGHVKHLPRAEKLPLTGYSQLASRLTAQGSDRSGPCIRAMYRRFELLNHRLLLHLQDELCELEEQLHRLDTADAQNRRLQNGILPASRRAEAQAGGELQFHKTDVLGKIGFKLEQYNRVLSSFQGTATLRAPTLAEIHEYRGYLATHTPVVDSETHFLDAAEDLICVGDPSDDENDENTPATPIPRREPYAHTMDSLLYPKPSSATSAEWTSRYAGASLAVGLATAVALSTITFSVVRGYLGRTSTVIVIGLGIAGVLVQVKGSGTDAAKDICICLAAYGIAMAVVASMCH